MTEWILLGMVSIALWAVVLYAYWYSMRETYDMRRKREEETRHRENGQ